MANPFYKANNADNNIANNMVNFVKSMQGQNPQEILNNLVNSGKVSQGQINSAMQYAQQYRNAFELARQLMYK